MELLYMTSIIYSSLCTSLGALPILFIRRMTHRGKDNLLAFTAGVMVAASTYGLIPSAIKLSNVIVLTIGILVGTLFLTILEKSLPHVDLEHRSGAQVPASAYLLMITMILHNLPEGLSVGVSYASEYKDLGPLVSFAIGLQNIPEGFLMALFLVTQGAGRLKAIVYTTLAGFTELLAALFGLAFGEKIAGVVPYGLAFAAGAMLFIVYKELIPESHGDGNERSSTLSFILGLLTMILLTSYLR